MAEIVWSEPALTDLDKIADFIAIENVEAARSLVRQVFKRIEQLALFPESGVKPPELGNTRYRQIIESPCRIFYRYDGHAVIILHVMRSERQLKKSRLKRKSK